MKKNVLAILLALVMVMSMGMSAFATSSTTTITSITNPRFVRANGNNFALGMGTRVIRSASLLENGDIKIYLQPATIWGFTGEIVSAKCPPNANFENPSGEVVSNDAGGRYMILKQEWINPIPSTSMRGIRLSEMRFRFRPFKPPGMPDVVEGARFTCDEMNAR